MNKNESIIYIVDDEPAVRKGFERLLASVGYPAISFANAESFLAHKRTDRISCLLLDVKMDGMSGLELQQQLERKRDPLPIIFLTGHGDVPMCVSAMKRGALDFLSKPVDEENLFKVVAEALARHKTRLHNQQRRKQIEHKLALLTPREREVMRCVLSGALNKETGAYLGIAEKTVKIHRGRMMEKMDAGSVPMLIELCRITGIQPQRTG